MRTTTIPEAFVTRVDFEQFWLAMLGPITTETVTLEALRSVKRGLLEAGVPTFTVYAYFQHLGRMVANTLGDDGGPLCFVEEVCFELEELGYRESGADDHAEDEDERPVDHD